MRRRRRKQRKIIIISSLTLLFIMTVGYAAFQTNINITAKGNILEKVITINELKTKVTTSGDGLYNDTYESGRYVYKGSEPNNYIKLDNDLWRIISIESDNTLKIMKNENIGIKAWDTPDTRNSSTSTYCTQASKYGCNAWAINSNFAHNDLSGTVTNDASLNTYLNNDYYSTLSNEAKNLIQEHIWDIGPVLINNADLTNQIKSEKSITWKGKIALMSASDVIRANSDIAQCGNMKLHYDNRANCRDTNFLIPKSGNLWTISLPSENYSYTMIYASYYGNMNIEGVNRSDSYAVSPAIYLTSNITLSGEGTSDKPYIIKTI